MGDPAGIGPEVVVKALSDPAIAGLAGEAVALNGIPFSGHTDPARLSCIEGYAAGAR